MSIYDEINAQLKAAMKDKDQARLAALRNIRASFLTEMKKNNAAELKDEVCVELLRRLEKQRWESIEAFEQGNRPEQAAAERADLSVVQEFLPKLADEAVTRGWLGEAIASCGATTPKDVGRVMAALMKAHKGEVDGTLARKMAEKMLSEMDSSSKT
jgi:hypothetical protein